jgi:hypothetical protein
MKIARKLLAALAAATALNASAGEYTDLWYNPAESGWGANVIQQFETAFVTLFVYGADTRPTWYVGPDVRVASSAGGFPTFTGILYRTTGPGIGGAFDPARVTSAQAGTITLEVLAKDRMRIRYTADGISVTKEVVRQTWARELTSDSFTGTFSLRQAFTPGGNPFGTMQFSAEVLLQIDPNGAALLRTDDEHGRRCEYRGPHTQAGKLGAMSGTFTCTAGTNGSTATEGTFDLSDFEVTAHGITGFLRTSTASVHQSGRFAALKF